MSARLLGVGALLLTVGGLGLAASDGGRTSSSGTSSGTSSSGDRGDGAGTVLGPGDDSITLAIEHSAFSTDRIVVHRGTTVRFVVDNGDPIGHELIVGPPEVHARHEAGTEPAHAPRPGEVSAPPLTRVATTYTFDEVGSVEFACHLPGHLAYGMVGEVEVIE